jgi:membrane protein YqaA with SNARE-associated domain
MKWIRSLYDWVLSWADTRYGVLALFLISFAESSFFPVPPDVLLIALCLGNRLKSYRFALVCSLGSILGGAAGYAIGWGLWAAVDQLFFSYVPGFTPETFEYVHTLYARYDFWIVFVAAFTPIPYKVITITAGVFGVSFPMFLLATCVGRPARFYLVAILIRLYGEPVRVLIDKHFNFLTITFTILLVGGFAVLKLLAE